MTRIYTPNPNLMQARPDPKRCPAAVPSVGVGFHQCSRKRGDHPDGWCSTHDPAKVAERDREKRKRYLDREERERQMRIAVGLREATVEQLRAELKRRGWK
jgi:hypothetical protein